ncbi:MAG: glycosyltransferase family 9 protein [Planctomycetota bacterium]
MNLAFGKFVDRWIGIPLVQLCRLIEAVRAALGGRGRPEMRSILLIKLWGAGNVVLLLPIVRRLRRTFPEARITFLTLRGNGALLAATPDVDEVLELDVRGPFRFLASLLGVLAALRRARCVLSIDFEQFCRLSSLVAWLSGAVQRVGLRTEGQSRHQLSTVVVPYRDDQHMSRTFFDLARAVGVDGEYRCESPELPAAVRERVGAIVAESRELGRGPLLVVHVGSGHNFVGRRWPAENFGELLARIGPRHDARILFTGVPDEAPLVAVAMAPVADRARSLIGDLTLLELVGLVAAADALFCNDTLPVHVASAVGTPVYAFYGPNTPRLYGPLHGRGHAFYRALPCSPCLTNLNAKESACRLPVCMESISVDEVEGVFEADHAWSGAAAVREEGAS